MSDLPTGLSDVSPGTCLSDQPVQNSSAFNQEYVGKSSDEHVFPENQVLSFETMQLRTCLVLSDTRAVRTWACSKSIHSVADECENAETVSTSDPH